MSSAFTVIQIGGTERLARLLPIALDGLAYHSLTAVDALESELTGQPLLFSIGMDALGPGAGFYDLVRCLRQNTDALSGCVEGLVVDGGGELYTKQAAQALVMAANLAGCVFPGKPLVEGTGSLYNQHILARRMVLSWEET